MANVNNMRRNFQFTAWVISLTLGVSGLSHAAVTDLASAPLQTSTTSTVLPNVMFMLDDSGSMAWDYLPDPAANFAGNYGYNSSQCNGVYYNPQTTYTPPVDSAGNSFPTYPFTAAPVDGYAYKTGTNTKVVNLNTGFTGGSGSGASSYKTYSGPAFYYTYLTAYTTPSGPGAQLTSTQKNYFNSSSTFYQECNSAIGSAPGKAVFGQTILYSASPTATITIPGNAAVITVTAPNSPTKSAVTGITVGGVQIMSASTSTSSTTQSATTLAGFIVTYINNCTAAKTGNCTVVGGTGYSAAVGTGTNANVVTISGPGGPVVITNNGTTSSYLKETVTTAFPTLSATYISGLTVGGLPLISTSTVSTTNNVVLATDLAAKITSFAYCTATVGTGASANVVTIVCPYAASALPGLVTTSPAQGGSGVVVVPNTLFSKVSSPTELQNFSNWYTYYSNRMLMMKTSVGLAFSPIGSTYRVGFMTMDNNVSPDFLDIDQFVGNTLPANTCPAGSGLCQKDLWYTKLYQSSPGNSTPLREALSHVGQLYAHKFGSISTYTATITLSGSGATAIDGITVNGVQLFPVDANSNPLATPVENSAGALAIDIANQINAPVSTAYGATVGTGASANVVTITGPVDALGYAPQVIDSGPMTEVVTSFSVSTTTAMLNNVTPKDPMQYSCQQNFVILSTDGYWNGPNTYDLNNNPVGQQDGLEPRPMNDGGAAASMTQTQTVKYTSQVQQGTSVPQNYVVHLQSATDNLQKSTMYLEKSTKSGSTWSSYTSAASCTPSASTQCMYTVSSSNNSATWTAAAATWATATSCTKSYNANVTTTASSGNGTNCQYSGFGTPTNVSTCNTVSGGSGPSYTLAQETQCGYSSTGSWSNTASPPCVAATLPSGPNYTAATVVTQCGWSTPTIAGVASCTPTASPTVQITCPGTAYTGPTPAASCTNIAASSSTQYIATTCQTNTTVSVTNSCTGATASASNNYTTTTCSGGGGGTPNTLADVAEYYYATDLRDNSLGNCTGVLGAGIDVCQNNVPSTSLDSQHQQHLTTFTLGLGARGKMVFPTPPMTPYQNLTTSCNPATDGDFCAILTGPMATSSICSWQAAGSVCNWPVPVSGSNTNVDDLWHAAVNGRGIYFSATDPNSLGAGLTSALAGIQSRLGAASASATSSPNLTQSNNFLFSATYVSSVWTGEVTSRTIDPTTGNVSTTNNWDAQSQLDSLINSDATPDKSINRKVYMFDSANASGNNLKPFLYGSMTASEQAYFNNQCNPSVAILSQCTTSNLLAAQIASGNSGLNLVDYLRGSTALETPVAIYRPRLHFLGDTVNSKPLYIQFPIYSFTDAGYSAFVAAQSITSPRQGVLYVGANDGMLHAFNANTGAEMWSYVPKIVMPNLYKLADAQYATNHQYYVDGSPATMDIYVASATNNLSVGWHTILVGGLGLGGQGFYALDVTNPSSPQALWEICSSSTLCAISDSDLGYSYGNPIITKRSTDGRWVVLVTSGYNNGAGSGKGTLFELDAVTGAVLHKTTTDATATNPPSGLAKISSWIDSIATNYTSRYVYAGDLNGNVWRFDLGPPGPDVAPTATMIASLKDPSGVAQSVTTRPELADPLNNVPNSLTGTGNPGVFVTTGRYLGASDVSNYQIETVYAIKDDLSKTGAADYYGNPRTFASKPFVQQFFYQPTSTVRTLSNSAVDWSLNSGWYTDFLIYNSSNSPVVPSISPGERVNIDPQLVNGTLIVVTNIPYASVCTAGGTSWQYSFDFRSGSSVSGSLNAGQLLNNGTALSAGFTIVRLSDGEMKALTTDAKGDVNTTSPPTHGTGSTQQTSWRELTQ